MTDMTDHTEQQLRKALGVVNDIEPPQDDLFVQRAVSRGRAKAARRRSAVLGAAAGVALVGVLGGGWIAGPLRPSTESTTAAQLNSRAEQGPDSAAVAPEVAGSSSMPTDATPGAGAGSPEVGSPKAGSPSAGSPGGVPAAGDTSIWLSGAVSPQRTAFDSIAPTLAAGYRETFGGAYATDPSNTHIVITETRHDPALEALVKGAMPAHDDVDFRLVEHTAAEKIRVAAQIRADIAMWRGRGVTIQQVLVDARTDRVVVTVAPAVGPIKDSTLPTAAADIPRHYGADLVTVVRGRYSTLPQPKLPGGSLPPTLQR